MVITITHGIPYIFTSTVPTVNIRVQNTLFVYPYLLGLVHLILLSELFPSLFRQHLTEIGLDYLYRVTLLYFLDGYICKSGKHFQGSLKGKE